MSNDISNFRFKNDYDLTFSINTFNKKLFLVKFFLFYMERFCSQKENDIVIKRSSKPIKCHRKKIVCSRKLAFARSV